MRRRVALVTGDGAGPEMMAQATQVTEQAALLDGVEIEWVPTPMGWNAFHEFGDTTPPASMATALDIGIIFFGGVGDPKFDNTIGKEKPEMMPEVRALLEIRKKLGLLMNFRPMKLLPALAHLSPLKKELIPEEGVHMAFIRFLAQDSYFGLDLLGSISPQIAESLGIKPKKDVTGNERIVTEFAYYTAETIRKYISAALEYARALKLPLISVDKSNVMPRYALWRHIVTEVALDFPDVKVTHQLVDSANALLFDPKKLHGVIACGNEHGDILSDGAAAMVGGMGLMHSSSINPSTNAAMFESGAGTAPTLAGLDKANPLGRILTGGMLLRHIGALKGAQAIEKSVNTLLVDGYRTLDIAEPGCTKRLTCSEMGEAVRVLISDY